MVPILGISRGTISKHISELKSKVLIERIGSDNGGSWLIIF